MFSKLGEVVTRFEELSKLLEDPQIYQHPGKLQEIGRERKSLLELVETYGVYKKNEEEIVFHQEILGGADKELSALAEEELPGLLQRREALRQQLMILLLPKDPLDEKNIFIEIRSGTGGEEAALFAGDLFKMYQRYADSRGWRIEVMGTSSASAGGFKEIIALFSGVMVYSHMKFEGGVHRVQRVPETESQGRIHTSTVTVAVLPEADELDVALDEKDLEITVCRSGGPGGQGVNTTDSAVRIVHTPSGITVHCQDERSQIKNKAKAKKILLARLYDQKNAEQEASRSAQRRSMVGSGERAEKIRTYNFPSNRVTDHRIGFTSHKLDRFILGEMDDLLDALKTHYQAEALKGQSS